jgi:hypothetical protein
MGVERCESCGKLSVILYKDDEPIAYVCPPTDVLLKLVEAVVAELKISIMGTMQ